MFLQVFCVLILCTATGWALYDDRNGDKHPNRDLWTVFILSLVTSAIVAVLDQRAAHWFDVIRSIVLSGAIYVSVFPFAVNYMLWKRGILNTRTWWNHLSPTAWPDRLPVWRQTPWYGRALFAAIILIAAGIVYFCPGQILFYGNGCFCGLNR